METYWSAFLGALVGTGIARILELLWRQVTAPRIEDGGDEE